MIENTADDTRPIWGARAIGQQINKPTAATYSLLKNNLLPAQKVGAVWMTTPSLLRQHFARLATGKSSEV